MDIDRQIFNKAKEDILQVERLKPTSLSLVYTMKQSFEVGSVLNSRNHKLLEVPNVYVWMITKSFY